MRVTGHPNEGLTGSMHSPPWAMNAGELIADLVLAWEHITRSFMALLWDNCRFTDPEALAALLKGQVPAG